MKTETNRDYLHRQLIKLGDMMGDGLHHEPDGKWIEREYKKISKLLFPEYYAKIDSAYKERFNKQVAELLAQKKCNCGGEIKQVRSGSKKCKCQNCNATYTVGKKKQ